MPSTIIGLTVGLLLIGTTELAAQDNCQPLHDAVLRLALLGI